MNAWKLGVLCAVLAAAVGCTASTPTADKPDGPPKNGGSYESPVELVEALDDGGVVCFGLQEMSGAEDPAMTQRCDAADDYAIVRIYDDHNELEAERDAFDDTGIFEGKTMLVGKNWTVLGPDAFIEDAHGVLGGQLDEGA